jgi:hypothetical protein
MSISNCETTVISSHGTAVTNQSFLVAMLLLRHLQIWMGLTKENGQGAPLPPFTHLFIC